MSRIRIAVALCATAALAAITPAGAVPNPLPALGDDLFTIHLPALDGTATCLVDFTPTSSLSFLSTGVLVGTANESGTVTAKASGCGSVSWTNTVTVKDEAVGHATRTRTGAGFGNPATASATQSVAYGVGVREEGLVTVTMAASSRLIDLCWADVWEVNASGNPSPVSSKPC